MKIRPSIVFLLFLVVMGAVGGFFYYKNRPADNTPASTEGTVPTTQESVVAPMLPKSNPNPDLHSDDKDLSKATAIINTDKGSIKFKFYTKDAPNTIKRIVELISQGFYNGVIFHRVIPGFVVQGGDPTGTGTGGSGQKLKAEFNERRHSEGTVAMARAADPDSADSQFYITLAPQPHLDRSYTVFGQVVEGMDIVRKLQVGDKMNWVIIE